MVINPINLDPTDAGGVASASVTSRFSHRGSPELEATLRRMVVIFRFLGLVWMAILVAITLAVDPPPKLWIVYASLALALVWTLLTWYMSRSHPKAMSSIGWFAFDSLAMLAIGAASVASGAEELFHGGLPLSLVFTGALVGGLPGSLIAALVLGVEQFLVHVIAQLGAVRAAGSVIFFVVGAIVGWTFDKLRDYDIARQEAQERLAEEQAVVLLHEQRAALADRIHDSVLQTLHAIRMGADDPAQSRYLARRQERELRRNIEEWRSDYPNSFRASLLAVRDEIEDTHRVEIEAVIRDDAQLNASLSAAVEAAREALANAAKHSGSPNIALYAEFSNGDAHIHVRDRGTGFRDEGARMRVHERLAKRVESVGGVVDIDSGRESGTEIKITVEV
jgi:signal transduction histidine kinase